MVKSNLIQRARFYYGVMLLSLCLFCFIRPVSAQEMPPRPISIGLGQNLSFGSFSPGIAGGTITISPQGIRTVNGTIIIIQQGFYFEAIFEIEANPGTLVSLLIGPDVTMTGSNGGTMLMHPGPSYPVSPVITTAVPPARTQVHLGGTLTIGNEVSNPPGSYSGFFNLMFIQD